MFRALIIAISTILFLSQNIYSQISSYPYLENFDNSNSLPLNWSAEGCSISTTAPRSTPNNIAATGNTITKTLTTTEFNFTNRFPDKLIYYERRSTTAANYRLELYASTNGIDFNILLAQFNNIPNTTNYVQRIINLDTIGLQNQSTVKFRWIIVADNTNNTGILRIDDVSLTVGISYDIGITNFSVLNNYITSKDSINLNINIGNFGMLASNNAKLNLYLDENKNNVPEQTELIKTFFNANINPSENVTFAYSHNPLKTGNHKFFAIIEYYNDENSYNDTSFTNLTICNAKNDVIINEIMYAPLGDEPEWIELFNSTSDTINLKNWKISDINTSTKSIITQSDYFFTPQSFIVIAKDANIFQLHPNISAIIANFSALNNSTQDAVVIYNQASMSIDSVLYLPNWGGQNGKSLERIDVETNSQINSNWSSSTDTIGSSPCKTNSVAKKNHDVYLKIIAHNVSKHNDEYIVNVQMKILNNGKFVADSMSIFIFKDSNNNHIADASEIFLQKDLTPNLLPNDSIIISENILNVPQGKTNLSVLLKYLPDQSLQNNINFFDINIEYEYNNIVINEIMYEPLNGQCEWLELFNKSNTPINLSDFCFTDNNKSKFTLTNTEKILSPKNFIVVASDSSLFNHFGNLTNAIILNNNGSFNFNNSGDAIILKDNTGKTIDSVYYYPSWHNPDITDTYGRSIERILADKNSNDAKNWSTCVLKLGGTPSQTNSVSIQSIENNSTITILPNPFSPDVDGHEDFCLIKYNLPSASTYLKIKIFDLKGRAIKTLADNIISAPVGEIIWDGRDNENKIVRIGTYILLVESTSNKSKIFAKKCLIVVAGR